MAERDLTQGRLGAHLAALAGPASIGMLFTTLYNVVDTFYAGWISTAAQAGLALSFSVFMVLMSLGFGLSQGASALIGGALGAGREGEAAGYAAGALGLAALLGAALGALGFVAAGPALAALGAAEAVQAAATSYLQILFLGLPGFLIGFTANGVLTAQGDTAANRNAQVAAFLANCALNPLLIYGVPGLPGLGFDGIALSTVLIQAAVALWLVRRALATRALRAARRRQAAPGRAVALALARQGLPASLTMMVMMAGGLIIQAHLQPFGAAAVAGFGIAFRVEQLILLPILSLSIALMPLTAQNFGAGDHDRVRQAATLAALVALGLSLMGGAALLLFGAAMTRLFTADAAAVASGAAYLRVAALMTPAYALMFLVTAFFQGVRRPVWSVVIGLYRQVFALLLFPALFVSGLGWGLGGVWAGLFVAVWSGFALSVLLAFRVGGRAVGGLRPDFGALRPPGA